MRQFMVAIGLVLFVATLSSAGQVWESTFDTDADGVVDLRTDNDDGDGEVMIGANTGGVQQITTESQTNTLANKAGRDTGSTLGHADSFSALYVFDWTFEDEGSQTAEAFAGFTSAGSPHNTRQLIGARVQRWGDYIMLGGSWASNGNTYSGYNFDAPIEVPTIEGQALQLAIGYDGATKILDVALYDITGAELTRAVADIREFDNLGFAPDSPQVIAEMDGLAVTHAGWTDMIGGPDDIDTTWNMDSLGYYNDATGAFNGVVPEPATGLMLMLCGLVWGVKRPRR